MSLTTRSTAFMDKSFIFIRKNGRHQRVFVEDILYLAAARSYLVVVTTHDQFWLSQNLSIFLRKNNIPSLIRVHRSYIVNLFTVDSFDQTFIYTREHRIPIGEVYKQNFFDVVRVL